MLGPLRHEPTAQHYLPGESSQRLPSVREHKLVLVATQQPWIGRADGGFTGATLFLANKSGWITKGTPPRARFFCPGIESTPLPFSTSSLVGMNQLVAALKPAARWLLPTPQHSENHPCRGPGTVDLSL